MTVERRAVLNAAWAAPVIALAIATPLAAASEPYPPKTPISCKKNSQGLYDVIYNDGSAVVLHQGAVNSDKTLQALCRGKGPEA